MCCLLSRMQAFCELFRRADTIVGCHKDTYHNDHIRVSPWDGSNRRVAFLAPYSAPTWVKRTIGEGALSCCVVSTQCPPKPHSLC
jgi:hypothetical protein